MATQRNKEDITIRQAWIDLTTVLSRKGVCNQVKNDALAQWVCFLHNWKSRLLRSVESIRQIHSKDLVAEPPTWGQVVVQHGEQEAWELFELGEFKEIRVAWSHVPRYVRKSGKESMLLDRGSIVDLERSCINLKTTKNPKGPTES